MSLLLRMGAMSEQELREMEETAAEKAQADWETDRRMRYEEELDEMFGEHDGEGDDYEDDEFEGF